MPKFPILALGVSDVEGLKAATTSAGTNVGDFLTDLVGKIGENMSLRRSAHQNVSEGAVAGYIHNSVADGMGKIGVLLRLQSSGDADKLNDLGP